MPAVMEQIDRMTTEEKFKTMDYIWSSISVSDDVKFPVWHERELKATEDRTGLFNGSGLMLSDGESFEVNILPSAMMDIVRGRYFYDQFEFGLGQRNS